MAATTEVNPKTVTIKGRLSFPHLTYEEAKAQNEKSNFKKADLAAVAPDFNLLIEQVQLDKLTTHLTDVFIPYVEAQAKAGEKRDVLTPRAIKKIKEMIAAGDWADTPPNLPIK